MCGIFWKVSHQTVALQKLHLTELTEHVLFTQSKQGQGLNH